MRHADYTGIEPPSLSQLELGILIGLFIGEIHFGGDRVQAQVTLRMSLKHLDVLEWAHARFPLAKLYGPYTYVYKDGKPRTTYQLMFRGEVLKKQLIPVLDSYDWSAIAPHVYTRYWSMKRKYDLNSGTA
jgi:hypothetical protein